jgi:hypothetical protein
MSVIIKEFIGGLGNQFFFQYITAVAMAYKLKRKVMFLKQKIAPGYVSSPLYYDLFESEPLEESPKQVLWTVDQFQAKQFPQFVDPLTDILIDGMCMNVKMVAPYLGPIREKFNAHILPQRPNHVCLGFRSFRQENKTKEWAMQARYYINALFRLSQMIPLRLCLFHVFTDDTRYAQDIIQELKRHGIDLQIESFDLGSRKGKTEILHFQKMTQCQHFILTNSSFHIGPAILSAQKAKSIVLYPEGTFLEQMNLNSVFENIHAVSTSAHVGSMIWT